MSQVWGLKIMRISSPAMMPLACGTWPKPRSGMGNPGWIAVGLGGGGGLGGEVGGGGLGGEVGGGLGGGLGGGGICAHAAPH